jgi:hypothetical protein
MAEAARHEHHGAKMVMPVPVVPRDDLAIFKGHLGDTNSALIS